MGSKTKTAVAATLAALTVVMASGWYRAHQALQQSRRALLASTLQPARELLQENKVLLAELQAEPYMEKDSGVLESYLIKLRRDGVTRTAPMKQRLDTLEENNIAVVALVTGYLPNAKRPQFATETNRFRDYTIAWRERWLSATELFMAGGTYAASEAPLPESFPAAVEAEIAAAN